MRSKYLKFTNKTTSVKRHVDKNRKTKVIHVENSETGAFLGWIVWHGPFRKYAFMPNAVLSLFDANCMMDIADKLNHLMEQHKRKKKGNG